jgi:cation diffusion facilitator CzcD-associated flavoprotein CzcO
MVDAGYRAPATLTELEARLADDLQWLCLPPPAWSPPRTVGTRPVTDVLIVGGGMCGLTAAAALKLLGVHNHRIVDRAPAGFEGPWITYARMETLRSPKELTGPCLGLPALTFRAWFQAQFGLDAWLALDKIPRPQWMAYLVWYRRVLGLPIENDTIVRQIVPASGVAGIEGAEDAQGLLEVELQTPAGIERALARHVVLATGRDGGGQPQIPPFAQKLSRTRWAHSADEIDFAALRGKRVAVIGAGASAMDNAATALEAGAARLDLFVRRPDLPRINKLTGVSSPGLSHGFATLSDAWKWRINDYAMRSQTPPPRGSTFRVSRHLNAFFHLGSPVESIVENGDALLLRTPRGSYALDFVIFGTGFKTDLRQRPELAVLQDRIKLWRDAFEPNPERDGENEELARSPYLGPAFECQDKQDCPDSPVRRIHLFNYSAMASLGKLSGDIPAVSIGAQRLAQGIATRLFQDDIDTHYAALQAYEKPELYGDEWTNADADTEPVQRAAAVGR